MDGFRVSGSIPGRAHAEISLFQLRFNKKNSNEQNVTYQHTMSHQIREKDEMKLNLSMNTFFLYICVCVRLLI